MVNLLPTFNQKGAALGCVFGKTAVQGCATKGKEDDLTWEVRLIAVQFWSVVRQCASLPGQSQRLNY